MAQIKINPVTIQLAIFNGYNKPPRMVDWQAIPTQIPGLYLTRPGLGLWKEQVNYPDKTGWNITHKSGWIISPIVLSNTKKANLFIKALAQQAINWDRPLDELQTESKVYTTAIQNAWQLTRL